MPLKAVFFDIDGTLVDSNDFHVMAWQEAFRDYGHLIRQDRIRAQIGKGADQLIPALTPQIEEASRRQISGRHGEIFRTRYLRQVKAFPGATEIVELLHSNAKKVVLASSAQRDEVDYYIELLKVGELLAGAISKDDVRNSKPAGDIFAAALAAVFPIGASETFAVGDTIYDVQSALSSGVRTIAVRSGGASEESLGDAGAAYVFASVKELVDKYDSSPLSEPG